MTYETLHRFLESEMFLRVEVGEVTRICVSPKKYGFNINWRQGTAAGFRAVHSKSGPWIGPVWYRFSQMFHFNTTLLLIGTLNLAWMFG